MIPIQLTLKNFLSYRDATLDFRGLHTACISGSNGAGKSSLLEAITWAIWGESRAATEDDIIHTGLKDVRVDFTFQANQQVYRVIRSRQKGNSSVLEFQVQTPNGFKALTAKGLRATQELVLEHVKLDYETFINSAYLRQGRADEFMLKRPAERKEILAELLKLNQYDKLEEKAKDLSRQFKAKGEELERSLENMRSQLQQRDAIDQRHGEIETQLNQLQQLQQFETVQLQSLQVIQHQRQNWEDQLTFVRQQYEHLTQDCDRLDTQKQNIHSQLSQIESLLQQANQIQEGFSQYQQLQSQEESLANKFQEFSRAQQQRQQKQQQLAAHLQKLERQLQQAQAQLEALNQQEEEVQQILSKSAEVEAALKTLNAARSRLSELDDLQMRVSPALQQRLHLKSQIERSKAGIVARIEQITATENQLLKASERQPQIQQAVLAVATQIEELEKTRVYLQRVQEKGQERRHFMERLQAQQREYERLLGELEQKLSMLRTPNAICPLCEQPLDEHHWHRVVKKTESEYQDTEGRLWVFREQMAVSDREIQVLRQEYREVSQKLAPYDSLREQRGKLTAQLELTSDAQVQLENLAQEREKLTNLLEKNNYAPEFHAELAELEAYLDSLNYNEQDHALARSEVERWRWAEARQMQIKDASKRQSVLAARRPELVNQIRDLEAKIQQEATNSAIAQEIVRIETYITELNYDANTHNQVRQALRREQTWQLRYQQLQSAQQQYPYLRNQLTEIGEALQIRSQERQQLGEQIQGIIAQLEQTANPTVQIQNLEAKLAERRRHLDELLGQMGKLEQMGQQLDRLQQEYAQSSQELQDARQQFRVYQELAQAFGKNGIQALMIENVLPQLEAETNHLLARLSANQLHIQFVTQKYGRNGKPKKNAKLIDTLDILIADARGTRSYETYSGGEAFRINFAIRLALAKLLAQRAGASLQLLIVDEGFGTQDKEGCDRLIAAINAIAADFACILTVTHMPHLKEAFQARIEVSKNQQGSHVKISI